MDDLKKLSDSELLEHLAMWSERANVIVGSESAAFAADMVRQIAAEATARLLPSISLIN